jgi:SAM-dependent methyltransferase
VPCCPSCWRAVRLDIDFAHLEIAQAEASQAQLCQADAHHLPYPVASFDLALCHFLLLWVNDPLKVLLEMKRVTRPGGAVLALAEPDYAARIDYPPELSELGRWQQVSLQRQGADTLLGRRLPGLLAAAGLQQVESGVLGAQWTGSGPSPAERAAERAVLEYDLALLPEARPALDLLMPLDESAWRRGQRVLFVPTFYAWGRVPGD